MNIPPNAVTRKTQFSIGFHNGTFLPVSGEASGHIIVIGAPGVIAFQQAVAVVIRKPTRTYKGVPVGFSIEENDKIKLVDTVFDKKSGDITFYSFRPIMFTWIYSAK